MKNKNIIKKLTILCACIPQLIFSEILQLPPMWLGNSEFYDRHQNIDRAIDYIEKELEYPVIDVLTIKYALKVIKYNLGHPIEENEILFYNINE